MLTFWVRPKPVYPARARASGRVSAASGMRLRREVSPCVISLRVARRPRVTPCCTGYSDVNSEAVEGAVQLDVEKACSKTTLSRARPERKGAVSRA